MQGEHFASVDDLNAEVAQAARGAASVLVKGSRFMKMERVVQALEQHQHQHQQQDQGGAGHAA
jgi:UDP-N-acetylmuramoyl-tripeptide--D-alanyl-D-alanine ligase